MKGDKINIKIFKPFGSSVSQQNLPLELIKDFKNDLDMIMKLPEDKKKGYRFGHRLAGGLGYEGEFLITTEVMLKWKQQYFDKVIHFYAQSHFNDRKVERIDIASAWHNRMLKNQWNPIHTHTAYVHTQESPSISTVGYIEIPKQMNLIEGEKAHHNFSGCLELREGSEGMFQKASHKLLPKVGQFLIFPANLQHLAYPHAADKPRISFSFNAIIKFKKD